MKKLSKIASLVLVFALCLSLCVPAAAANATKSVDITYRQIKIVVNGAALVPADATGKAVEPFILDGTTYLPVRAVAGALGLQVGWDAATSTVTLTSGGQVTSSSGDALSTSGTKKVDITYRDIKIILDGAALNPTDAEGKTVEPFILDGTTYLPVRAVANALGLQVGWDAATSTVTLNDDAEEEQPPVETPEEPVYLLSSYCETLDDGEIWEQCTYSYDENNRLIDSSLVQKGGLLTYDVSYEYDEDGRLSKVDIDMNMIGYTYYNHIEIEYLKKDSARLQFSMGGGGVYCYSSADVAVPKAGFSSDSFYVEGLMTVTLRTLSSKDTFDFTASFDEAGRWTTHDVKFARDGYSVSCKAEYDTYGNMTHQSLVNSEDSVIETSFEYKYDQDGKITSAVYLKNDGPEYAAEYTYDANGCLVSVTKTYFAGNVSTVLYEYIKK